MAGVGMVLDDAVGRVRSAGATPLLFRGRLRSTPDAVGATRKGRSTVGPRIGLVRPFRARFVLADVAVDSVARHCGVKRGRGAVACGLPCLRTDAAIAAKHLPPTDDPITALRRGDGFERAAHQTIGGPARRIFSRVIGRLEALSVARQRHAKVLTRGYLRALIGLQRLVGLKHPNGVRRGEYVRRDTLCNGILHKALHLVVRHVHERFGVFQHAAHPVTLVLPLLPCLFTLPNVPLLFCLLALQQLAAVLFAHLLLEFDDVLVVLTLILIDGVDVKGVQKGLLHLCGGGGHS